MAPVTSKRANKYSPLSKKNLEELMQKESFNRIKIVVADVYNGLVPPLKALT